MRLLFLFALTMLTFFMNACQSENSAENVLLNADEESLLSDAINYDSVTSIAPAPKFLMPSAGFYSPFVLESLKPENGGVLRCTFDGAEPDLKTPVFEPGKLIDSSMVVACYEFLDTLVVAKSTQTYFINETKLTMPVVSIRVAPEYVSKYLETPQCSRESLGPCEHLWDTTEYPIHLEFFANGSSTLKKNFEINAGILISGGANRIYEKRSVRIHIRKKYQENKLKYPLFKIRPEKSSFKAFVLRSGGSRFISDYVGDAVAASVLEGTGVDYQRSRLVVVFYNGVFHGIYDLRERLNEQFVKTNYGIDPDDVDFLKQVNDKLYLSSGSVDGYQELLDFVGSHDFENDSAAYETVCRMMDVGNFANYMSMQIYYRNLDWPRNNVRVWRSSTSPWKFVAFDLDLGLDWGGNRNHSAGTFDWIKNGGNDKPVAEIANDESRYFHNLYKKLIANKDFRRSFINHASILYGAYINAMSIENSVDAKVAELGTDEVRRDMEMYANARAQEPYTNICGGGFSVSGSCIKEWARQRDLSVREEFKSEFGLSSDVLITLTSKGSGNILLENMKLPSKNYRGKFFGGNAMLLTAEPEYGAEFKQWEDGSTENPRLIENPVDGAAYSAIFE